MSGIDDRDMLPKVTVETAFTQYDYPLKNGLTSNLTSRCISVVGDHLTPNQQSEFDNETVYHQP